MRVKLEQELGRGPSYFHELHLFLLMVFADDVRTSDKVSFLRFGFKEK